MRGRYIGGGLRGAEELTAKAQSTPRKRETRNSKLVTLNFFPIINLQFPLSFAWCATSPPMVGDLGLEAWGWQEKPLSRGTDPPLSSSGQAYFISTRAFGPAYSGT